MRKSFAGIGTVIGIVLILWISSGCGNQAENLSSGARDIQTIYVSNFDFMGRQRELTFHTVPKRVLVARPEILDVLLALHAEENICAVYLTRDEAKRIPYLKERMPHAQFLTSEIDRETALMLNPDFIIGWRRNFRKGSLGDMNFWKERDIPTYIEENSGPVPSVDPFPPSTVESEIQFIENMGRIFQKEKEAEVLIDEIRNVLQEMEGKARRAGTRKAMTLEFLGDKIEIFGDKLLSGDIIRKLGCTSFNYEEPFITREDLRVSEADTIFVIYHGSREDGVRALQNFSSPEYRDIPAVKKGKLILLPYRYICAPNIYTAQCIREIYKGLYE